MSAIVMGAGGGLVSGVGHTCRTWVDLPIVSAAPAPKPMRMRPARNPPYECSKMSQMAVTCRGIKQSATRLHPDRRSAYKVDQVAQDVDWPPAVLVGDGDPDEVSYALHEGRRGEEIRDLGHRGGEELGVPAGVGAGKEVHGDVEHGDGWSGGEEVAHHHGDADDCVHGENTARVAPMDVTNRLPCSICTICDLLGVSNGRRLL